MRITSTTFRRHINTTSLLSHRHFIVTRFVTITIIVMVWERKKEKKKMLHQATMMEWVVDAHSDDDGSRRVEGKFSVLEDDDDNDKCKCTHHSPTLLLVLLSHHRPH